MKTSDLNQEVLLKIKNILDNAIPQGPRYYKKIEEILKNPLFNTLPLNVEMHASDMHTLNTKFAMEVDKLVQKGDYPTSLREQTLQAFRRAASLSSPPPVLYSIIAPEKQAASFHTPPEPSEDIDSENVQEQLDCLEKQGLYKDVPSQCCDELKKIAQYHIESGGESRTLTTDIFDLLHGKGKVTENKANKLAKEKDNLIWSEVRIMCPKKQI